MSIGLEAKSIPVVSATALRKALLALPSVTLSAKTPIAEMGVSRNQAEVITLSIIQLLEKGVAPWRQPWSVAGRRPYNAFSGRPYSGLNVANLALQPFDDPRWATFNQVKERGGFIRKGERGTPVFFWKIDTRDTGEQDADGKPILERRFIMRLYSVFNVQQADGLNLKPISAPTKVFDPIPEAEAIASAYLERTKIPLTHDAEPRAYYVPSRDTLHLPNRNQFSDAHGYYATLFHELGHSTGHSSRLNRQAPDAPIIFGSPNYSKEELVAEFASAFLCSDIGIKNIQPQASYLKSWLDVLRQDPAMLVFSASAGERAANFIQGTDIKEEEEQEVATEREAVLTIQGQATVHQHQDAPVDMAQLGPQYWQRLHAWAQDLKNTVGSSCDCGDLAVHAMQGFHDAVNVALGKPAQHPDDLRLLAGFTGTQAEALREVKTQAQAPARNILYCPRHGCQPVDADEDECPECAEEAEVNSIATQSSPVLNQDFLHFLLYGAATAAGASLGASLISKLLTPKATSPEDTVEVVDSKGVYSPKAVAGDQAQVDLGTLLAEIDTILKKPDMLGLVDPHTQKVLRKAG